MLFVKKLDDRARLPICNLPGEDMGYDVFALDDVWLYSGVSTQVKTGISMQFCPWGDNERFLGNRRYGLLARDRGGMAAKGIIVSGGVFDASYTGDFTILLTSLQCDYKIKEGDKIAQVIPIEVLTGCRTKEVDELPFKKRGENRFGSTGK